MSKVIRKQQIKYNPISFPNKKKLYYKTQTNWMVDIDVHLNT